MELSCFCVLRLFGTMTALGIAALFVDLQQFLGLSQCYEICNKLVYCSGAMGFVTDLAIAGVS